MRGLVAPNALTRTLRRHNGRAPAPGKLDLGGVFVPVPTPYLRDGRVDYGALAANFERWERIPFKGETRAGFRPGFVGRFSPDRGPGSTIASVSLYPKRLKTSIPFGKSFSTNGTRSISDTFRFTRLTFREQ